MSDIPKACPIKSWHALLTQVTGLYQL